MSGIQQPALARYLSNGSLDPTFGTGGVVQTVLTDGYIDGIAFHYFSDADVIRHRLVREIVKAYAADAGPQP